MMQAGTNPAVVPGKGVFPCLYLQEGLSSWYQEVTKSTL
jgi:hypothetical protein